MGECKLNQIRYSLQKAVKDAANSGNTTGNAQVQYTTLTLISPNNATDKKVGVAGNGTAQVSITVTDSKDDHFDIGASLSVQTAINATTNKTLTLSGGEFTEKCSASPNTYLLTFAGLKGGEVITIWAIGKNKYDNETNNAVVIIEAASAKPGA